MIALTLVPTFIFNKNMEIIKEKSKITFKGNLDKADIENKEPTFMEIARKFKRNK